MATLEQLREKYGERRHEPNPDCKKCNGEGEYWFEAPKDSILASHMTPCACIFFPHEDVGWIIGMLAESAKKALDEIRKTKS